MEGRTHTPPADPTGLLWWIALRTWVLFALFGLAGATLPAIVCALVALGLTRAATRGPGRPEE